MKKSNLIGQKFGRLLVISFSHIYKGYRHWVCQCDCGKEKDIRGSYLIRNLTISCGCARVGNIIHGMYGSRFYRAWANMKIRCNNKSSNRYYRYGGRGVKVCDRWRDSFQSFMDDMYKSYLVKFEENSNCQIDRTDNNGDYDPENCKWVSPLENNKNRSGKACKRKFDSLQVIEMRKLYDSGINCHKLSKIFKADSKTISSIVKYKTYKDII